MFGGSERAAMLNFGFGFLEKLNYHKTLEITAMVLRSVVTLPGTVCMSCLSEYMEIRIIFHSESASETQVVACVKCASES